MTDKNIEIAISISNFLFLDIFYQSVLLSGFYFGKIIMK